MILNIDSLSFSYDGTCIFRDLSFDVNKGEIVCAVGPNGSGKSTLLDCITGFLKPGSGSISVCSRPLNEYSRRELSKKMAYVPQQHSPTFPYTVRDVIMMGRTSRSGLFGTTSAEDKDICENAMEQTGITDFADRAYNTLSGGELKLVILARALAQQPELIILDEPTSSLDFRNELKFLEILADLVKNKGISAVTATHSLNQAFFFERAGIPVKTVLLSKGRPPVTGTPDEVINEEMLKEFFGVNAKITVTQTDKGDYLKQIVLLNTEKDIKNE